MNTYKNNPVRFWSIIYEVSILIMAIAAGYAYGLSFNQIHVENNNLQTLRNIQSNSTLFYSGVFVWCIILITDIIVSYEFYRYLKPTHKTIAIISGALRLIYSIFLGIGISFLYSRPISFNKNVCGRFLKYVKKLLPKLILICYDTKIFTKLK